jgi:opacity protein-like surface antigen
MNCRSILLIIAVAVLTVAPWPVMAEQASHKYPGYTELKGGYYYPSDPIRLDEFSSTDFDKKKGFNGEIGFGHHYGPVFGTEFGIGYFENKSVPAFGPGETKLEALPVLLSAKLFLPLGPIEPYAEAGVGAYFTVLEVEGTVGGDRRFREVDFGTHAGAGVNINFTDAMYLGVQGRYRWVRPDYDGQDVRLDGYTATLNLGFRY